MVKERLYYIQKSEGYFKIYLNLLRHYGILTREIEKIFDDFCEKENYQIEREDKIKLYKLEKA